MERVKLLPCCTAGQIRFLIPAHIRSNATHIHISSYIFPYWLCQYNAITEPQSYKVQTEIQGAFHGIFVSTAVFVKLNNRLTSGVGAKSRPYHRENPILSGSILGIMNTRLWLEPGSDLCLKSSEQQSQQAIGAQIANYVESQQATQLRIKAVFVWQGWSPLSSSGLGLSFTPFGLSSEHGRLCLLSQVFRVNIISPLGYKAHILSSGLYLNHTSSRSFILPTSVICTPHLCTSRAD